MQCPTCQFEQSQSSAICGNCGLVFAKYRKYHEPLASSTQKAPENATKVIFYDNALAGDEVYSFSDLLFRQTAKNSGSLVLRALLFACLTFYSFKLMFAGISGNAAGMSFLHLVNLPFHEAGHVIFGPFGRFIKSLGGTLGQLLMPLICCLTLLWQTRDPFGASVTFWWLGENFLDIAPYMNDAQAGELPLVGGNYGHDSPYGFHDWEFILNESGLLKFDHILAKWTFGFGCIFMLLALAWAGYLLFNLWRMEAEN